MPPAQAATTRAAGIQKARFTDSCSSGSNVSVKPALQKVTSKGSVHRADVVLAGDLLVEPVAVLRDPLVGSVGDEREAGEVPEEGEPVGPGEGSQDLADGGVALLDRAVGLDEVHLLEHGLEPEPGEAHLDLGLV